MERLELPEFFAEIKGLAARVQVVSDALEAKQCVYASNVIDFEASDDTLTRTRQLLRQLQNLTQPVMRLPPEIVGLVFTCVREECEQQSREPDPFVALPCPRHTYGWIKVMQICHYWREVARRCPQLWTTLMLDSLRIKAAIRRTEHHIMASGTLPLTVELPTFGRKDNQFTPKLLCHHLHRIRTLRLSGKFSSAVGKALTDVEAPLLETFAMYTRLDRFSEDPDEMDDSEPITLPKLFKGVHPRLTSLAFCTFRRYGENKFRQLRHLHMSKQGFVSPADFYALLEFLAGMPTLEHLMLSKTRATTMLNDSPRLLNPRNHRVSLPRLQRLVLSEVPLSFAGLVMRSLSLHAEQDITTLYKAREYHIEAINDVDVQDEAVPALHHLLGEEWDQIVRDSHTASIHADGEEMLGWSLSIIGPLRETCFEGMFGQFEQSCNALHGLVQHVGELWLSISEDKFEAPDAMEILEPSCPLMFLKDALHARKVYLNVDIREHSPLPILTQLFSDPEGRVPAWEECHISINHGDEELTHGEAFFMALAGSGSGTTIHIYLHTEWCAKVVDPLPLWQDALRRSSNDVLHRVQLHLAKAFPTFPVSTRCVAPAEWHDALTSTQYA